MRVIGCPVAHGYVGGEAQRDVSKEPKGELPLEHSHDGLRNKQTVNVT